MSTQIFHPYNPKLTINNHRNAGLAERSRRYTSNNTMAPTYTSGPGILSPKDIDERVRVWNTNIQSVPSPQSLYSDASIEGTVSSLTDSVIEASTNTTPSGPRYRKRLSLV